MVISEITQFYVTLISRSQQRGSVLGYGISINSLYQVFMYFVCIYISFISVRLVSEQTDMIYYSAAD